MKISIIIPVHDSENIIENCVRGIIEGNPGCKKQIILVENGSSDNSLIKCQQLSEKFDEVECYESSVIGPSAARNIGIEKANGQIIGFCDADDCYLPNSLKLIMDIFAKDNELKLIIGCIEQQKKDGLDWLRRKKLNNSVLCSKDMVTKILCDSRIMGSVCNKFYKSEILKNIRFNQDIFYCEDTYFNIALIKRNAAFKVRTINKVVYLYVKNGKSATNNVFRMFDENNHLKYIEAMLMIEKMFSLNDDERKSIIRANYILAVDAFNNLKITECQRKNLMPFIKDGFIEYKTAIGEDTFLRYVKFILKGKIILGKRI